MNQVKVLLWACWSVGLLWACGSSSNENGRARGDGGDAARGSTADAGRACNPFSPSSCARGQTCCLSGYSGTCQDLSACSSSFQFECTSPADCDAGEICCGTFVPGFSGPILDASGDARAEDGGYRPLVDIAANAFCAESCSAPSVPLCRTSADCPAGASCEVPPEGGNPPILGVAAEALLLCAAPDGGAP
jgi:hypothetical protein